MEFKEIIKILQANKLLIVLITSGFILGGITTNLYRGEARRAMVDLNVFQTGRQETNEYTYDNFYRLQADEKFSDTIVQWLNSPRINQKIMAAAGSDPHRISVKKLSPQYIKIEFLVKKEEEAENITKAVDEIINKEIAELNQTAQESSWFKLAVSESHIQSHQYSWSKTILVSILIGIFVSIWAVMIKHYLSQ